MMVESLSLYLLIGVAWALVVFLACEIGGQRYPWRVHVADMLLWPVSLTILLILLVLR